MHRDGEGGASGRICWRPVNVEVAEPSPGQVATAANDGMETRLAADVIEEELKIVSAAISVRDSDGETVRANDRARDLLSPLDRGGGPLQGGGKGVCRP